MENKPTIYTFDPVIYPRMVWITVTNESKLEGFSGVPKMDECIDAEVDEVHDAVNNLGGVLIRFKNIQAICTCSITHESNHAAMAIFDYVGAKFVYSNQEPFCYLAGWIAKCCAEVKEKELLKIK